MLHDTQNNIAAAIDVEALAREGEIPPEIVGRGMSKKDAKVWLKVTEILRRKLDRPVKPADYVAFAKTKQGVSIKHLFTWDDNKAATKYRELEAAHWCRSVRVVLSGSEEPMRAVVNVIDTEGNRGYIPTREAGSDDFYKKQVLAEAARDLRLFRARFECLSRWLGGKLPIVLEKLKEVEDLLEKD